MIFNLHGSDRPLVEEVNEAEQRLMLRRHEFHAEAKTLGAAMRQRATAPDTLLWSVATGYIFGELTRTRAALEHAAPGHAGHAHEEETRPPGKLQLLLRYVAIARPIMASATSLFLRPFSYRMGEQACHSGCNGCAACGRRACSHAARYAAGYATRSKGRTRLTCSGSLHGPMHCVHVRVPIARVPCFPREEKCVPLKKRIPDSTRKIIRSETAFADPLATPAIDAIVTPAVSPVVTPIVSNAAGSALSNRLLAALPRKDRESLTRQCEPVTLNFAQTLHQTGETIEHIYFPLDSLVSPITSVDPASARSRSPV